MFSISFKIHLEKFEIEWEREKATKWLFLLKKDYVGFQKRKQLELEKKNCYPSICHGHFSMKNRRIFAQNFYILDYYWLVRCKDVQRKLSIELKNIQQFCAHETASLNKHRWEQGREMERSIAMRKLRNAVQRFKSQTCWVSGTVVIHIKLLWLLVWWQFVVCRAKIIQLTLYHKIHTITETQAAHFYI